MGVVFWGGGDGVFGQHWVLCVCTGWHSTRPFDNKAQVFAHAWVVCATPFGPCTAHVYREQSSTVQTSTVQQYSTNLCGLLWRLCRSGSAGLLRNRAAARHLARFSSSSSSSSGAPRRPLQGYTAAAEPATAADTGGGGAAAAGGGGHGRHQQQHQQQHGRHGRRRRQRPVVARFGLSPEVLCEALPVGEDVMPIPVVPVALFPYMQGVLDASYEAFGVVRGKAGV